MSCGLDRRSRDSRAGRVNISSQRSSSSVVNVSNERVSFASVSDLGDSKRSSVRLGRDADYVLVPATLKVLVVDGKGI